MARRGFGVVAGLAVLVATATICSAQTTSTVQPVTMTMPTCAPVPISLSPCIGYVFGVGSAALPSCCSSLQAFFQSQGPCLCAMSKLAPSPFGLVLGQVQGMIPNVCNLPSDPCEDVADASTSPDDSTPPTVDADAALLAPATAPAATPDEPATTTSTTPESAGSTGAPPVAGDAAATATGKVAPQGAGPNTGSQGTSKLPELLHAAGAPSSAAGTVLISVFIAYVSAMFV